MQCMITVKWKALDFATLLRLLQPVDSSWETLAGYLIRNDLWYKIDAIRVDAYQSNSSSLIEALLQWRRCTKRDKRTWQTLCDTAKKYEREYGSQTLEQYLEEKKLVSKSEFYVRNFVLL